ncbi:hypothetical protein OWV82_022502 [Melia azedarach]|uniref:Uncharacterized protein n=1 Tax=Melia azedarach TaxID=155640 RepID=A0ACC1WTB4_MELAZ|nr:hypothetical protein OWV82_022502 [Melia azedarach]
MSTGAREPKACPERKASTISHSKVSDLETVLVERDQLKDVVAQKNKEIEKLRATIQFVLQYLSKAEVDTPKEIPSCSTTQEMNQAGPVTPDQVSKAAKRNKNISGVLKNSVNNEEGKQKILGKRNREASNSPPNEKSEESSNPPNKKTKTDGLLGTFVGYHDSD